MPRVSLVSRLTLAWRSGHTWPGASRGGL